MFAAGCKQGAEQLGRPGNGDTLSEMGLAGVTRRMQVEGLGIATQEHVGLVGNKRCQIPIFPEKKGCSRDWVKFGSEMRGALPSADMSRW